MEAHGARQLLNKFTSVKGASLLSPLPLPSSPLPLPSSPRSSALSSSRAADPGAPSTYRHSHTQSSSTVTSSVPSRCRWAFRVNVTRQRRPPPVIRVVVHTAVRPAPLPLRHRIAPPASPPPSGARLVLHAAASRASRPGPLPAAVVVRWLEMRRVPKRWAWPPRDGHQAAMPPAPLWMLATILARVGAWTDRCCPAGAGAKPISRRRPRGRDRRPERRRGTTAAGWGAAGSDGGRRACDRGQERRPRRRRVPRLRHARGRPPLSRDRRHGARCVRAILERRRARPLIRSGLGAPGALVPSLGAPGTWCVHLGGPIARPLLPPPHAPRTHRLRTMHQTFLDGAHSPSPVTSSD